MSLKIYIFESGKSAIFNAGNFKWGKNKISQHLLVLNADDLM